MILIEVFSKFYERVPIYILPTPDFEYFNLQAIVYETMSTSVTVKSRAAFGGITLPNPREP